MNIAWSAETRHFVCEEFEINEGDEFWIIVKRRADQDERWIFFTEGGVLLRQMILATPADTTFIDRLLAQAFVVTDSSRPRDADKMRAIALQNSMRRALAKAA